MGQQRGAGGVDETKMKIGTVQSVKKEHQMGYRVQPIYLNVLV